MTDLKPCPFCGATQLLVDTNGEVKENAGEEQAFESEILCSCGALMIAYGRTDKEAVHKLTKAWNRRAKDES